MTIDVNTLLAVAEIVGAIGIITTFIINIKSNSKKTISKYVKEVISPDLKEIKNSVDKVQKDVISLTKTSDQKFKEVRENSDKKEMQRLRYECLCFASSLRNGVAKTRQEYEEIFRMEDSYNSLIDQYKVENGYMHEEMLYVHNQYRSLINK